MTGFRFLDYLKSNRYWNDYRPIAMRLYAFLSVIWIGWVIIVPLIWWRPEIWRLFSVRQLCGLQMKPSSLRLKTWNINVELLRRSFYTWVYCFFNFLWWIEFYLVFYYLILVSCVSLVHFLLWKWSGTADCGGDRTDRRQCTWTATRELVVGKCGENWT